MNLLLIIVIAGIALYFIFKIALLLSRPFFLARFLQEIEALYSKTKAIISKDIETASADLEKWNANDKVFRVFSSEKDLQARVKDAKAADQHEKEVYEKFMRYKEQYIQNPRKLSDVIVVYKRYLEVKLRQCKNGVLFANAITSGAMTFEEFENVAKESIIILQENERKLDVLLGS